MSSSHHLNAGSSSQVAVEVFWKSVWKIHLPPKLKIFLWSLLHDKLPTNDLIHARLPHFDPNCRFCGEVENVKHLLFSCHHAASIWIDSPLRLRSSLFQALDIKDCWLELLSPLKDHFDRQNLIQIAVFIMWHIWKSRNAFIFQNIRHNPAETIALALQHHEEFANVESLQIRAPVESIDHAVLWTPPPQHCIKLNFDAAIDRLRQRGSIAVIARNWEGKPVDWCCKVLDSIWDPLVLEGLACREAMLLGISRNFHSMMVEGDSLMIIEAVSNNMAPLSIQSIIQDVCQLANRFNLVSFSHVKRSGNQFAHDLAAHTLRDPSFSCNRVAQQQFVLDYMLI
ncbi:hypothetical protein P3X46_012050 [Hevea brasiliensis]|uniref:RNase H type-1 domain-containing protein n=1 Tax=Hevea brasiliensis TaxID=3981 RepID=A0ABQ9M9E4_HEVBR|nr:hypothetical protein P3X46_012050 [Hevea brasiliensis]